MWKDRILKQMDVCYTNVGGTQGLEIIHVFCSKAFMLQVNSEFLVSTFEVEANKGFTAEKGQN